MLTPLWAALAMAAQDLVATVQVIAEARGRGILAGLLDVVGDAARLAAMGIGLETVLVYGWSGESALTLGAMFTASFFATMLGTRIGQRLATPDKGL